MRKLSEYKTKIYDLFLENKKIFSILFWVIFVIFVSLLVFFNFSKNGVFTPFEVSWGNFDLSVKKLPYNVKTIDISFSKDIDSDSISKEIFSIQPYIPWILKQKSPNTISYELTEKLTIGQDYTIVISKNLLSTKKDSLQDDAVFIFSAVPWAKVVKVLPEEKLDDLTKNLVVFFSIPQISLTSLEEKNNLACPIEITPKVDWKCSWTTTSVLEFIPKTTFAWATKYDYEVKYMSWMNYELENNFTWSFVTPELQVNIDDSFIPKNYINLSFNFPVDVEEINKNLSLYSPDFVNKEKSNWVELKYRVERVLQSQNSFLIKPLSWEFFYDTSYKIDIKSWLKPKYWNIALKKDFSKEIKSTSLISDIETFKNIYSNTWALIDTRNTTYENKFLSNNQEFFRLNFYEDVLLNKDFFQVKDVKNNKNIDFKINYFKEENDKKEIVDNKKSIKLELNQDLVNDNTYTINLLKKANNSLQNDVVYTYNTSKELKVLDYKFIDYSKSCLYLNNELDNFSDNKKYITFSNSWALKDVTFWEYIYDWNFERSLDWLSFEEKNNKLISAWYCPQAKNWEYLYALQTRLNPNTNYQIFVKKLTDKYWNILQNDFIKDLKTSEIKPKDKYIYTHFNNFINVFPKNLPIIFNIQTINTQDVYAEICEMSEEDYKNFLLSPYWNFTSCLKKTSKKLPVRNNFWNLTHNKFDLENDILWYKTNAYFVWIEIFTDENKSKELNYSRNLIVRTDMSLFLEKAKNKSILYATDFVKNDEVKDLKLDFYDYNYNKTTIKYSFDTNKKAYIIDSDLENISYLVAKNDKNYWVVSGDDFFSNYDFKYISWMDSSTKNYAYVYSDRPIYRPGDEVFIKWLLREFHFDGFKKSKIKTWVLTIIDENWENYRTLEVKIDENSNFSTSFVIPKESNLWNFRFNFSIKDNYDYVYTNWYFSIEEYKKPTFKVDIESLKNDVLIWEKVNFKISPKYYFWWNLVNTTWVYSVLSQNYFFDAKEFWDYQFWIWSQYFECIYWGYCNFWDNLNSWLTNFKIDENWKFEFDYNFSSDIKDAEKIYTFNFDVVDPDTKKTVSNSVSKVLHTTDSYVWVKSNYYNSLKDWINADFITLDFDAKQAPFKNIKVELIKKDYKQVRKLWVDWIFYNEYSQEDKVEKTITLITDDKWFAKTNFKPLKSWEYEIKASYTWKNWKTFSSSQQTYVAWDEYISWRNDNNTVTELEADKITYKLWETATFTLKSPVNNWKAIVFVEKDDGIIDYFVHNIKSYWDKIELKINKDHYPNVYLKAYLIWNQEWNPLPVYKRALSVVKVVTDYKKLNISILTDKNNYKPWDKMQVTIEVTDADWKIVPNANGSLSIVDESVLALKWNPRKNPYSFFYDMKRYLWVVSYSNLKYLVEKLEIKDVSDGEKWWAWDQLKGWDTKKLRWNFKDTAFWLSDFTTDKTGKSIINIPLMPDNLTTWVIEALVSTPEDNKIWVNYTTVMTQNPVIIEDNLPRFLNTSDTITFAPVIYNKTGKDSDFVVSLEANNWVLKSINKTVWIKNWESQKVEFLFEVKNAKDFKVGDFSTIKITATSKTNSSDFDWVIKFLPIINSSIIENVSTVWKTDGVSFEEKINISNKDIDNAKLKLNYGWTLFSYLLDGINYLETYPYGCSEQRTSAIMPNIYIKNLYDAAWIPFDLNKKMVKKYIDNEVWYKEISVSEAIKDYLIEIKKFQNNDWGFMYFYDTDYKYSDIALTNYILTSLSKISSLWYEVDKKMQENTRKYLKNEFYKKTTCSEKIWENCISLELKSEILLALNNYDNTDYEVYKMFKTLKLDDMLKLRKLDIVSRLSNIATLTESEKESLKSDSLKMANEILSNELVFNPRWAFLSTSNYSRVVNTAKFLEIIWNIWLQNFKDIESITDNMIRFIASYKINNSFGSTYDNSLVLSSLTTYLSKTQELKNTSLFARFNLNSKEIETKKIDKSNIFEVFSKEISSTDISKNNTFNIEKTWSGNIYYDLNLSYYIPSKDVKSADEWFYVEKKYFSFNEYKKIESLKSQEYEKYLSGEIVFENLKYPREVVEYLTPINSWKVWDLVLVYNKLVTNESRDQVALESFIPAWSEIVNTNLDTENKQVTDVATNIILDRKEFRDDRYFAWKRELEPGIYNFSYTIRLTHSWVYQLKPTIVSEFYTPEVFGRSSGGEFRVE